AFLQDVAANLLDAAGTASIAGYMAFGPPGPESFFRRHLPAGIGLIDARSQDFGECPPAATQELLRRGHAAARRPNADNPTHPTTWLTQTAALLARPGDRAVIGPASDGGYYLLGLKQVHRRMFEQIDWSTDRVAGQTIERAREIRLPIHVLPAWYD